MIRNLIENLANSLATWLTQFLETNYPGYFEVHSAYNQSSVEGFIEVWLIYSFIFFIILIAYIGIKYIRRIKCDKKHKWKGYWRRIPVEKDFKINKNGLAIYIAIGLFCVVALPISEVYNSFIPYQGPEVNMFDEMKMDFNDPITRDIVQSAIDNIVPSLVEGAEVTVELIKDPELAKQFGESVTGLDFDKVIEDIADGAEEDNQIYKIVTESLKNK